MNRKAMDTISQLILAKIVEYILNHTDEIIDALRKHFPSSSKPEVNAAIQELGFEPSEKALDKLAVALQKHLDDPKELASLLVVKTTI